MELLGHLQGEIVSFELFTYNGLKCCYISLENVGDNEADNEADDDFLHSTCVIGKQRHACYPIAIHYFINSEVHALLLYAFTFQFCAAVLG
jgi:hypothetical protein